MLKVVKASAISCWDVTYNGILIVRKDYKREAIEEMERLEKILS